jgi:short-subunit dehydrogenase
MEYDIIESDNMECKKGPNVIIIGASLGLGLGIAQEYGLLHSNVVIASRDFQNLKIVSENIRRAGASGVTIIDVDVTDRESLSRLFNASYELFNGCINRVIYNVGRSMQSCFVDIKDMSIFKSIIDVNYKGLVNTMSVLIPILKHQYDISCVKAKIAVTICMAGKTGIPQWSIFSAAKHAMVGFVDSLRVESNYFYDITTVYPGIMATGMETRMIKNDGKLSGRYGKYHFDKPWFETYPYYMPIIKASEAYVKGIECSEKCELYIDKYNKLGSYFRPWSPCISDFLSFLSFRIPGSGKIYKLPKRLYYTIKEINKLSESLKKCGYKDPCQCPDMLPKIEYLERQIKENKFN